MKKTAFLHTCICKNNGAYQLPGNGTADQLRSAVTVQLISTFVFALKIVQYMYIMYLYFLHTIFQAFSHLLWLCRLVCVDLVQNPETDFLMALTFFSGAVFI